MSPLSGPVLGAAALVSSPALWNVIEGTAPVELALVRFLVSMVICWMAIEVVAAAVGPTPRGGNPETDEAQPSDNGG